MKKHRWYKPGSGHRGGSRKCLDCGIRRRIKPSTRLTWQYRYNKGETWLSFWPCRPAHLVGAPLL